MPRTDLRPTRRSFVFAFLAALFGLMLPRRPVGTRFTSIEGSDLERLIRWCCGFNCPKFAGAS